MQTCVSKIMILEGVFKMKGIVQTVSGFACVEASFLFV